MMFIIYDPESEEETPLILESYPDGVFRFACSCRDLETAQHMVSALIATKTQKLES